jgi:hypothetical protein
MLLVAIAWTYVVLMVAIVEATSRQGTVLGALITFALYAALPLSILAYLFFSPARIRRRRAAEAASSVGATPDPDGGDHASSDLVAPVGKEP